MEREVNGASAAPGAPQRRGAEFAGLVAVVTGGASGIGLATATLLADRGAQVAVLDIAPGPTQGGDGEGDGSQAAAIPCDVADDASVRAAVAPVIDRYGRLDIVVNNAGIGAQGTVADGTDEEWLHVLDVNVLGIVRVSRAALPYLRRSPAAAIVNLCSIVATTGLPERALYAASKGAVLSLTRAMAVDHIREGIRVNCVNPGTVATAWVDRLLSSAPDPAAERAALEARQPHGRLVTPTEVASAIAYLASPYSASTNGVDLAIDAGTATVRLRPLAAPAPVEEP